MGRYLQEKDWQNVDTVPAKAREAMMEQKTWEQETLELIAEAEQDRNKAIQRVEAARKTAQTAENVVEALKLALNRYRQHYGLPPLAIPAAPELAAALSHLDPRALIDHWSDTHNGKVVMKELCNAVVQAGQYKDARQAAGSLYSTVKRMPGYAKAARGVYQRKGSIPPLYEAFPDPTDGAMTNGLAMRQLQPPVRAVESPLP